MYTLQLIETLAVVVGYIIMHYITKKVIHNTLKHAYVERGRRKMILKAVHFFTFITGIVFLAAIWGLKQSEIAVFVGSLLTALGIAFFAQWSLLSNITSSVLLFINHPIKIGDTIKILDKDAVVEGEVSDLTFFFVYVKTEWNELITIPNSLLLQKSVSIKSKTDSPSV
jgi:small-conductance mechanosensitive channel